ncbi:MAG: phage head morphogenesis protein [Treponematales bacterium]
MANEKRHDAPIPEHAIEFVTRKIGVPTENWDDLKWGEFCHGFTVAHSTKAGIADTINGLIQKAVKEGQSFQNFRNDMLDMMKKEGWYGGAGHTKDDKEYINWRIGVIYDTNTRTAYQAEHYRKQLEGADLRPIWIYNHDPSVANPRMEHLALDGKAFRYDDPFWDTYYPKNGWGCKCFVTTESEYEAKNNGREVCSSGEDGEEPDIPGVDWDKFDPTWKYNSGREALAPNFDKYEHLPENTLKDIYATYRNTMDNTRLTEGEFRILLRRTNEADYGPVPRSPLPLTASSRRRRSRVGAGPAYTVCIQQTRA